MKSNPETNTTFEARAPARGSYDNKVRHLYSRWLQVESACVGQLDDYHTEGFLTFDHGWAEVRRFSWSSPSEIIWGSRGGYLLDMVLNRPTHGGAGQYLSGPTEGRSEPFGQIKLTPPGQTVLSRRSSTGRCRSVRCALDASVVESLLPSKPCWGDDGERLRHTLSIRSAKMEWLLHTLSRELQRPRFASAEMAEAIARQLAVELIRELGLNLGDTAGRSGGLPPWRLRLIRERVERDGPPPSLDELAALCNITVRHLTRAFREETGETIGGFIAGVMALRAGGMLKDGARVADVARALGYSNTGSFSAAFRKVTGLSPGEVKQSIGRH